MCATFARTASDHAAVSQTHNPSTFEPQSYNYTVPLKPGEAGAARGVSDAALWHRGEWRRGQSGFATLNGGVVIRIAAVIRAADGAIDLGLDDHNAHVRPDGLPLPWRPACAC